MKNSELRIGATYSDGKKGVRRIVDRGPQYKLYDAQEESDCLLYAIVKGPRPSLPRGQTEGGEWLMHSTVTSFAAWAKTEITFDPL